ncbi:DUF7619 domain-containing protein [Flavobacterium phycosphaerae]|uniref:DUF7619 domain-containing protein n=1 Tax=Flavobacterium phycosphaerae TaxID=2697515 RepID=UPI00138ABAED|nr:T9SS type A sorting domain-containing protein [Flavobacterium phycosphaerae]
MKNYYSLLLILLVSFTTQSQIVIIPDANFKNALVNTNCVGNSTNEYLSDADTNDDGEIQESEAAMVIKLSVSNQGISDLTGIEAFTSLQSLSCNGNSLTSLTLNNFINLRDLGCSNNNITNLSITNCFNLYSFNCAYNPMTTIDLSSTKVYRFYIANNPNLTYVNIKNGFQTDGYYSFKMAAIPPPPPSTLIECPNLATFCCDDFEVYYVTHDLNFGEGLDPSVNVNSYCSSLPGGSFNTITGIMASDCDGANVGIRNQKIAFTDGSQNGYAYTNYAGGYSFYTGPNALTVTPQLSNPAYFSVTPLNYVFNFTASGLTENANFCLTPTSNHPDLEIIAYPLGNSRPGFNSQYMLTIINKGNQIQSGTVTFTFDGSIFDYVASFPTSDNLTSNTISWNIVNFGPNQSKNLQLVLNLNSPQETPPVNLGDILSFQATITSALLDDTPNDNQMDFNQTVVGSFDPNDKTVVEGESISIAKIGDYLHYVVRFQNTGTDLAEQIVIKDMLDANLDWSTLEMVASSHPYRSTLTSGNKFEVFYDGINLPPSATDEEGSHGYIAFKIKPKSTIVIGDVIANTANIYFDFNFPIVTNTVTTSVVALGTPSFNQGKLVTVYPNPVSDQLQLSVAAGITVKSVTVYNALGQKVIMVNNQTIITMNGLAKGAYFVAVETDKGKTIQKVIKL